MLDNIDLVVLKITNRCNLNCQYCYEYEGKRPLGQDMSQKLFRKTVDLILMTTKKHLVNLLFHGGEPTLLSLDWFRDNVNYVHKKAEVIGKKISFSIQTNLIDISDDKLDFFKKERFSIGGSLDNPEWLDNSFRPNSKKALETFKRAQNKNLRIGVLFSINQSTIPYMNRICFWLSDIMKLRSFKANVAYSVGMGRNLSPLKSAEIFEGQKAILEYMLATKGERLLEVNLSAEIVWFFENFLLGIERCSQNSICLGKPCGSGRRVIAISPKGKILPCGRFSSQEEEFLLGTVPYNPKDVIDFGFYSSTLTRLDQNNENIHNSCHQCEARYICSFGCGAFIYRSHDKKNIECEPTKMRLAFYKKHREELIPIYLAIKKAKEKCLSHEIDQ